MTGRSGTLWRVTNELILGTAPLKGPFRGSWAVREGLVSERALRGPRYHRLFYDIYLPASAPVDLTSRSSGAYLLTSARRVLSGYSAAELLGARCAPADANAELTVPGGDFRERPGLTVYRDMLAYDAAGSSSPARCARRGIWRGGCRRWTRWWPWMRWPE